MTPNTTPQSVMSKAVAHRLIDNLGNQGCNIDLEDQSAYNVTQLIHSEISFRQKGMTCKSLEFKFHQFPPPPRGRYTLNLVTCLFPSGTSGLQESLGCHQKGPKARLSLDKASGKRPIRRRERGRSTLAEMNASSSRVDLMHFCFGRWLG